MPSADDPPDETEGLLAPQLSFTHSFECERSPTLKDRQHSAIFTTAHWSTWRPTLPAVEWCWDILGVSIVYIVEGFTDLAGTAVQYYMKDELGLSPSEAGLAGAVGLVPWNLTPILGLLTDCVPVFGYHRKAYLTLIGIVGCGSWVVLPRLTSLVPVTCAVLVGNLCSAWSQVVGDAVTVKLSQGKSLGVAAFLQSLSWVTYTCGAVAGGLSAGHVLDTAGPRPVFVAMAAGMLLVSACALLISERKEPRHHSATGDTPAPGPHTTSTPRAWTGAQLGAPDDDHEDERVPLTADTHAWGSSEGGSGAAKAADVSVNSPTGHRAHALGASAGHVSAPLVGGGCGTPRGDQQGGCRGRALQRMVRSMGPLWTKVAHLLRQVWTTLQQPHIRGCALFVFVWQSTPAPTSAMFYFQTNYLGLQPSFMELMYLLGSTAGFLGVLVYNLFLVRCALRGVLLACALAGTLLNASQLLLVSRLNLSLGLSDQLFSLGDYSLLSVLAEVMLTPMLALAARVCPDGAEATLAATLYSLLNLSRAISAALGAAMTSWFGVTQDNFSHMLSLTLVCNLLMFLPLPLLALIPPGCGAPVTAGGDQTNDACCRAHPTGGCQGCRGCCEGWDPAAPEAQAWSEGAADSSGAVSDPSGASGGANTLGAHTCVIVRRDTDGGSQVCAG